MDFSFLSNDNNVLKSGATDDCIQFVHSALGVTMPQALTNFLKFSDGAILSERVILFSCQGAEESLVAYNNKETVTEFLRFGRFSADEFGYKREDLSQDDPPVYVLDHETNEYVLEANNLIEFMTKYNNYKPKKKKWYSFLFS